MFPDPGKIETRLTHKIDKLQNADYEKTGWFISRFFLAFSI